MKCPLCKQGRVIENPSPEEFDEWTSNEPPWDYGCRQCGYAWSSDDLPGRPDTPDTTGVRSQ